MTARLSTEIRLTALPNETAAAGLTTLEAVALLAGEVHSDAPDCVCPVLAEFARILGAAMPDAIRTALLVPLVPALIDTRDPASDGPDALHATELERKRGKVLLMWGLNSLAPQMLAASELYAHASALASTTAPGVPNELADAHAALQTAQRSEDELQLIAALHHGDQAICFGQAQHAAYCVANAVVRWAKRASQAALAESIQAHAHPETAGRAASARARAIWAGAVEACRAAADLGGKQPRSPWASVDEPINDHSGLMWRHDRPLPRFAKKWMAFYRHRLGSKPGRHRPIFPGEPRPRSGQGRPAHQREHLEWFVRSFPKVLR